MESIPKDKNAGDDSSPIKKNKGVDCNGMADHQPKGISKVTAAPLVKTINGLSNHSKDNCGEQVNNSTQMDTSNKTNEPLIDSTSPVLKSVPEQAKQNKEGIENEKDTQINCNMSGVDDIAIDQKKLVDGLNHQSKKETNHLSILEKQNSGLPQGQESKGDDLEVNIKLPEKETVSPAEKVVKGDIKALKSEKLAEFTSKVSLSKSNHLESSDDIEIIGESFTQMPPSQNAILMSAGMQTASAIPFQAGFPANSSNLPAVANMQSAMMLQNMRMPIMKGGLMGPMIQPGSGHYVYPGTFLSQGVSLLNQSNTHAPPVPKSSMDQIELIRWEIQNRINVRPKYFKPNPSSELGALAKFLFDIGSDLIKESVYHDLVKIQSKKNEDDKLSDKERDDLAKLKEIEKDLQATIGHLKLKFKKRCQDCNFQTESINVMFFHKQFPHEDNKNLKCAHCTFSTKQSMAFKFHMEAEHAIQGRLHEKKAFFECHMCPYENNQQQKLVMHRERCLKQFRPLFNLHPSCLSGAEINLCLENIFYKALVPKNLKLLQQKHAQQQAAIAEAKRQQAQVQMIAAQKNAAALIAKKQQQQLQQQHLQQQQQLQLQKRQFSNVSPRFNSNVNTKNQSLLPRQNVTQQPAVRHNAKPSRQTVANMLNNKANNSTNPVQNSPPGGFEVCEICGGYVKDRKALRIHFFYAHRIDLPFNLFERTQAPLYCATCYVRFWTAQGLRKHIDTHKEENQTRGVVGKCISCGHHVLNLVLHMRIVHNRELQHYINALMCMFCGGHFSSRQDCERHIIKTHGNVDPGSGTLRSPPLGSQVPSSQGPPSASVKPSKKSSGRGGVANSLVKGSVCVLCNLNFGRNVDLTRHCMRMHHTCMKCGMVVIDKASLLKHTCLTSPSGTRDCGMCGESGFHPAYYVKHLRDKHLRKFSIKVAKVSRDVVERWTKCPFPFENDVLVEISDSDEESLSSFQGSRTRRSNSTAMGPVKKPKIGPACSKIKKPFQKTRIGPASKIGRIPVTLMAETENDVSVEGYGTKSGREKEMSNGDRKIDFDNDVDKKQTKKEIASRDNGFEIDKQVEEEHENMFVATRSKANDKIRKEENNLSISLNATGADLDNDEVFVHSKKRKLLDNDVSKSNEKKKKVTNDIADL